ncbi:MAG TPA: right-handed parallel beta-helix repeat-containing protein [Pyrinomonadaceae bacterium]|nr:right-handed parallel beta-helix repeat-containing protein [Pyrinomonadaceae bacterium]
MHLSKPLVLLSVLAVVGTMGGVVAFRLSRGTFTESVQNGKRILNVGPRDSLQAALDAANYGDTIVVQAGAALTGNFTLPKKSGTGEIVIQSSRISELPEGKRVKPSQSALFAKLQTTNAEPVITTAPGAHHYRFQGIEFSPSSASKTVYDVVRLGEGRKEQKTLDAVPHHLVIDRCYIHGFDTQDSQRGINLNSAETTISNSYISDIHMVGIEAQAIAGWNGPGPFHIINNYLEGSTQNILFGGADPASEAFIPSNIEIRGNHLFKPMSWKVGHPTYAGKHWTVKNILELKDAKNVVIDGNVLENCWTDGQTGIPILFTVRNQEGSAPYSVIQNVTFTNNIVRNAEGAINFLGSDNEKPSQRSSVAIISNNLFVDIHGPFLTLNGFNNVSITHNTHMQTGNIAILYGTPAQQFVYRDNLTIRGSKGYGVFGDATGEGNVALKKFVPDCVFKNNVLIGADAALYPKENQYPASIDQVGFVNFEKGDYRLGPGSPYKKAASDGQAVGVDWDKLNFSAKTVE